MKVGTKIALVLTIVLTLTSGSAYAIQVPKLEKNIQALEHTVTDERKANEQLVAQNKQLADKVDQSEHQVQELNQQLIDCKQTDCTEELDNFQVTWYNDSGITKSGNYTQDGLTVSVDPSVIPLGTWIRIQFEDGTSIDRRADDTGGAVNGRILDVYKNAPTSELCKLGRSMNVKVFILNK